MYTSSIYNAAVLSMVALANAHGVILGAQGEKGSPPSVGFQVNPEIARNCTGISPCQQDTTIIRDAEINANIVNECGRTELTGNIDVGENTENALAAGAVTSVKAGTVMDVTIHQVNADGAGPYVCDLDQTGNAGIISQNLTVTNNVPGVNGFSQAKTEDFTIKVTMPDNLACTGGSPGNVCTVRCRNNAVAGPFGGCFAVQQTDNKATAQSAEKIQTAQSLDGINKQITQNNVDLKVAVDANQKQGLPDNVAAKAAADKLVGAKVISSASPVQTPDRENIGVNNPAATAPPAKNNGALAGATSAAAGAGNGAKKSKAAGAAAATGAATKAAGAGAATATNGATKAGTGKANKNNGANANANAHNKKRGLSLKWAKRSSDESA